MGNYSIAWDELKDALQNEEACDRYSNGYRKEKEGKEPGGIIQACSDLKAAIEKGVYLGTVSNVCII